jgi:3-methyl-2-oxobutanoate hydroxymethyltransferase
MQGKEPSAAQRLVDDAKMLEQAGASVLFLECIPPLLAEKITSNVRIPTIGIGAGPRCDGQILVSYDMLGLTDHMPRFCKNFLKGQVHGFEGAVRDYVAAVRAGDFPAESNSPH